MSLSNGLLELHGINVVVKEALNTHEIISCSGSKTIRASYLPQRVAIDLQNRRMIWPSKKYLFGVPRNCTVT